MMRSACLMILNYEGREWLSECIGSAREAASKIGASVVVLDNPGPSDDASYIAKSFPDVELVRAPKNDFLFSYNAAVAARKEEIVFFLNNDMRFDPAFAERMISHFDDPDIFAVTAKTLDWSGKKTITARRRGYFSKFWFYKEWDPTPTQSCYSLDFCGGASAVRRSMFVALGGFDTLFRPGYCEDLDISYRAWMRGWKVAYEPSAEVFHHVSASFKKKFGENRVSRLIGRNHELFTLKNCGGVVFLLAHLVSLPFRFLKNLAFNPPLALGMLDALPQMPKALSGRSRSERRVPESYFLQKINRRFVFLTSDSKPMLGGVAEYLDQLCRNLVSKFPVELLTTVPGEYAFVYPYKRLEPRPARNLGKVPGDGFAVTRKWNTLSYYRRLRAVARRDISGLRNDGTVAVIGVWTMANHFWCVACRERKIPYVVICHGLEMVKKVEGSAAAWRPSDLSRAKKVIANSSGTARLIEDISGTKATVVNPGANRSLYRAANASAVDAMRRQLGIALDAFMVLGVGRVIRRKGFDLVIQALADPQNQSMHFVVAGEGPEKKEFMDLAARLGVSARVHWIGACSDDEKALLLTACDVFAMPNRTLGGSEWEGFGIAFIEAALFGKPSIGGNNGGVADAIVQGKTGFLVDTSDAAGTTQALQMLMMDKDMRIAMGRAARQRAEMDFDWKKLAISFAEAVS